MLLAKIKENKVYFGKLVTFFLGGRGYLPPYLPPRRYLQGVTYSIPSKGGVKPKFYVSGGLTPSDPLFHMYGVSNLIEFIKKINNKHYGSFF